ncbi:uncharacterized protein LOC132747185 [Ruditapes philippinarum]|uniref:uncharacterized protein LOC132747185 n=1 Tax=Ruditapes philippinarum TaxID=129788 RepID=UPI00295B2D6E|nr:uncharacterized protein LOC132747185 [Ruditapes philippinarum]XP_060592500.1 uncharacterized protein LOC132747185 [Ruditapes philippinarum]XP_060592501.1 uncharacterized protein LOC132747185 [Ruditapes philippinarum]
MFATKSLRGAVMFPKNRLMRMKDLQKRYTANRYFKTLTQEQPVTTLLKRQYSIPKSKQALNVCSWCKHNHGQFIPQMLRNTRNHLLLSSSIKDNALSKNSLNRLYRSMQMMGYHARGYATQADITTKVSVSKPIPSRRVARKKQTVDDGFHHMNVMCYAVGDELNLTALRNEIISGGVYDIVHLPRDIIEGIMITAKYQVNGQPREAFFFRDGGVALWHMSESEVSHMVKLI